jgi:hypothetical protein
VENGSHVTASSATDFLRSLFLRVTLRIGDQLATLQTGGKPNLNEFVEMEKGT